MQQRLIIWKFAWRYLRGKRSRNAVPILSRISMIAIGVASAAMIILFSVFNGFEGVVQDMYKAFYPDIRITPAKGKFFALSDSMRNRLESVPGISRISEVIEDNVLVNSDHEQIVVTLKGIDRNYLSVNDITPWIIAGRDSVTDHPEPTAIVGAHIAGQLGVSPDHSLSRIVVFYPDASQEHIAQNPASAFQSLHLKPDGIFRIQDDFDGRFILAPLGYVQRLFREEQRISSIEIRLSGNASPKKVQKQLRELLGPSYNTATQYEQNRTLYMVMRTEKWAVYAILFFVLLIASFNMIGALSLLVLEKTKDMAILRAMGAFPSTIRNIFIAEGVLWALTGGLAGLVAGTAICLGQQYFGWIKLDGAFIIEAYPVEVQATDILLIITTVIFVGMIAAFFPASKAIRSELPGLKS